MNTISPQDIVNGGAGTDTLKIAFNNSATPAITLPNISSVEVIEVQATKAFTLDTTTAADVTDVKVTKATDTAGVTASAAQNISVSGVIGIGKATIDGGKDIVVNDATADVDMDIGQTIASTGTITVTDTQQGTGDIKIDGGTDVTVTVSGVTTGALDIGQVPGTTADPSGAVVVNSTGAAYTAATAADVTLGAIKIDGGKTISVTQKATSDSSAAAAKTGATNYKVTQSAVTIKAGTTTTDVTVKQDAAVSKVDAANTTGGVTETASVKFGALAAGKTVIMGGLTLTATVAMTATEVAAAFANLINGAAYGTLVTAGDTQSGALATKGVYTGVFTGWTSGAANGDTVVFTSTTPNSNPADLADGGDGSATTITTTDGKAHDATLAGGKMGIVAGVVDITGAAALKTVNVDGYAAAGNKVQGATNTALDTVTLANGGSMTIDSAATTLALSATNVSGTIDVAAGTTTLNATVNGAGTATLKSASAKTVNVVAGSGSVAGTTATGLTAATAINTTGFTGTATFTLDSTATSYTGGAGKDIVTFSNATAATKAIDLGAGDDTLVFVGTTAPTVTLKGGDGTDTLSLATAGAATLSGSTAFAEKLDGFERLLINDAAGNNTINLENLGFTNYVTTSGSTGTLTLNNLASNGTVVLTTDPTTGYTVGVKDAATSTADVLNVILSKDGTLASGLLTAANVETINLTATDTNVANGISTHTLTLKADSATSLAVTGNAGLTLTLDAATNKLATIDAHSLTGGLTASANGAVAMTITGGSGKDVLTASTGATAKADVLNGGAGNDTLIAGTNGAKLTGGADNDLFVLTAASSTAGNKEANTYSTITDFSAGDLLKLQFFEDGGATENAASFSKLAAVLDEGTAVFANYVTAAMEQIKVENDGNAVTAGTDAAVGQAIWFMFHGDSYVVVDSGVSTTGAFANGEDLVIKLTGVDLTSASWNATHSTLALA
ncbi:beta strand repeat-containing protein [Denitratisoma sp. DHT3]|uniref:beta strand repeat-containing protein n=1 Tax=Denitratisoma sp. DHT3 TaxID=1981880 RepID=UPI0011A41D37|nr:hypothetical protein [Denitratisoma sp. DHT3]